MTETSAARDWEEIVALFPLQKTRFGRSWNIGVSSRMSRERIGTLRRRDGAGKLDRLLETRSLERVKALRTYAAVNLEQASAALRMTVLANVTIPVIVLTVLNLILPGTPAELVEFAFATDDLNTVLFSIFLIGYLVLLASVLGYSVIQLSNARDIRHLIDLHAAERGVYFGLEDTDIAQPG